MAESDSLPEKNQDKLPVFRSKDIIDNYDNDNRITSYIDLVLEANKLINIVSRETSREDLLRMAASCLIPLEFGFDIRGEIFDIGPGGGFPSIVLMLARPAKIKATLIERTGKKANFLKKVLDKFNLRAEVYHSNFVEIAPSLARNRFDFGLMKYVKPDKQLISSALSILKAGGKFIYYSELEKNIISNHAETGIQYFRYLDDLKQVRTISILSK